MVQYLSIVNLVCKVCKFIMDIILEHLVCLVGQYAGCLLQVIVPRIARGK